MRGAAPQDHLIRERGGGELAGNSIHSKNDMQKWASKNATRGKPARTRTHREKKAGGLGFTPRKQGER